MKKTISIVLALMLSLVLVAPVLAASTVYTDKSAWEAAAGAYVTEDFSDATLNPGVSVISDQGYVTGGLWWDLVDDGDWFNNIGNETWTTTWTFAVPIVAWGGTFDAYNPGGPGSSIKVTYVDGTSAVVGYISQNTSDTFWGFVSDEAFTQVRLEDAEWLVEAAETYEMDDMVYSFFPGAKITGGGYIKDTNGKKNAYSVSGNTMADESGALKGNWVIRDFPNKMTYHLDTINSLVVGGLEAETPYAPYRAFTIKASGFDQEGNYAQATIVIKDIQEPGKESDILQLWVNGAYLIHNLPIDSGDFQAHLN